ncbi:MAG: hypothetical protein MUO58_06670 [Anaerolineales bacterium]|nr:hypothetical protein [Anaerolineales bacterium]
MAGATLGRDNFRMDVVFEMAPGTFTDSGLQCSEILRSGMAACTIEKDMFTNHGEGRIAVVKRGAVGIQTIMTSQAGRVKITDVLSNKRSIIRYVACVTGVQIEASQWHSMALSTH